MGWIKQEAPPHVCQTPDPGTRQYPNFGDGSLWQCDDCETGWGWVASHWTWLNLGSTTKPQQLPWWSRWRNQ